MKMCRKPEIMADAAYAILTKTGCELTGKFLIDDEILSENGVTDFDQYANVPGKFAPEYGRVLTLLVTSVPLEESNLVCAS